MYYVLYIKETTSGIELFTKRISNYYPVEWNIIPMPKNAASLSETDLKKKEGTFAGEAGRKNQCYKADDIKLGIRRDCAEPGAINSLIKAIRHKH